MVKRQNLIFLEEKQANPPEKTVFKRDFFFIVQEPKYGKVSEEGKKKGMQ